MKNQAKFVSNNYWRNDSEFDISRHYGTCIFVAIWSKQGSEDWKNFLIKVAQIFGDFWAILKNIPFLS